MRMRRRRGIGGCLGGYVSGRGRRDVLLLLLLLLLSRGRR
jgi:hypothetical protein